MIPVQTQTFSAFLDTDSSKSSFLLADLYSSGGSQNLYIDKLGRIRPIKGYSPRLEEVLTTDTGDDACRVVGLFPYRKTTAGVFTRQIMAILDDGDDEWELWYSTDDGVTFTFVADLGPTSVGRIPSFQQFGDELYIVNGAIAARMWDGSTLVTVGATRLSAPTIADGGAGPLNGEYRWRIVPRKNDGTRKPGSAQSSVTSLENRRAGLTWIADADTNVVGYEVYRTRGTGLVFYMTAYVDGRTTVTYTDALPDGQLIGRRSLMEHGDAPPTGVRFMTLHKGRAWYFRTDTFPRRGWRSDPGDADSVYLENNYHEFTDADTMGDMLMGAWGDFEGMLVAFLERAIFTISGSGNVIGNVEDWSMRRTNAQMGAIGHRVIAKVPKGAKYQLADGTVKTTDRVTLAYLTPNKDIRIFDGNNDEIVSACQRDQLLRFNHELRYKAWCVHDHQTRHIIWFFPSADEDGCTNPSTVNDSAVAWNYDLGTWHYWTGFTFGHGIETDTSSQHQLMLMGEDTIATGGWIYVWKSGTTFYDGADARAMTAILLMKPIHPKQMDGSQDFSRMVQFPWIDLLWAPDASPAVVEIGWLGYADADDAHPKGHTTCNATGRERVSMLDPQGRPFYDFGVRPRVAITKTDQSWALIGGTLGYRVKTGLKRRTERRA